MTLPWIATVAEPVTLDVELPDHVTPLTLLPGVTYRFTDAERLAIEGTGEPITWTAAEPEMEI